MPLPVSLLTWCLCKLPAPCQPRLAHGAAALPEQLSVWGMSMPAHSLLCWWGLSIDSRCCLQIALPEDPPWWQLSDVAEEDLLIVCRVMHELYQQPKATYISLQHLRKQAAASPGQARPAPAASPELANGAPRSSEGLPALTTSPGQRALLAGAEHPSSDSLTPPQVRLLHLTACLTPCETALSTACCIK